MSKIEIRLNILLKKKIYLLILLLLFIFPFDSNYPQSPKVYIPEYSNPFNESWRWQSYPELIGRGCRSMVEDKDGTYWFGVNGGVLHYDGLLWDYYPISEDSSDIPVVTLCFDDEGSLYAATNEGVSKFFNKKLKKFDLNLGFGDPIQFNFNKIPIIKSWDGSIIIGSNYGLLRIKNNDSTFYSSKSIFTEMDKLNQSIQKLEKFDIYNIFEDETGELWFGLRDGRIYKTNIEELNKTEKFSWKRVDTDNNYTSSKYPLINKNSKGEILICSSQFNGGINVFNGRIWKHIQLKNKFNFDEIYTDIIALKDGNICIAGLGRIFIEENNEWKMYASPTFPFSSNRLNLYQTIDESLWLIGLGNEVWKIDLSKNNWTTLLGLNFQMEDKYGNQWFISFDGKIVQYNLNREKWFQYDKGDGVPNTPIALLVTKSGKIWIVGSHDQIAATAFFNGSKWVKQLHPTLGWSIDRRAVFEASDGSLWFGSSANRIVEKGQRGGLVRYKNINYEDPDKIEFEYHHPSDDFSLDAIYGIGQSKDGRVWVGQQGFYSYDLTTDKWQKIYEPQGLDNTFIDCIATAANGDVWIGTRTNGLFWLNVDEQKWNNFTTENGLSSNTIVNIYVEDENVWVSTDRDIAHYDGTSWNLSLFSGYFRSIRDGFSIQRTSGGSFWINQNPPIWYRKALHGIKLSWELMSQYKTVRYFPDDQAPETEITFSQKEISQPGNVLLSWDGNDPWKSTSRSELQYSFRIDDNNWSPFTSKTSDIFLAVDEGSHTFDVRARDINYNVDNSPASISFFVLPPVWKEPWFILLIFSFISIITFFMIYLYRRNKIIREISDTKIRLFANISHELRTPLVLILGPLTKILESQLLDEKLLKHFNLVNRNTHRLLRLVNQILDFRKMEAGQLKFEPNKGDIIAFLKEEFHVFEEASESKNIELTFSSEVDYLNIWFDFDKLEKVVFNILSNSLKYTPENGKISVSLSIDDCSKSHSIHIEKSDTIKFEKWLTIKVKDNGVGIAKKELDRIFKRFYQVRDLSKTAVGGTGIGLAVVKELVKILYGKINVESEFGKGTSFSVQIPLIDQGNLEGLVYDKVKKQADYIKFKYPEKEKLTSEIIDKKENILHKDRSKVLVVEDNLDMREYITEELEKYYNVIEAKNGVIGFEQAVNENPDLILSDIMMPQMDGIEFCKKIKTDERTSHIALILLTARSSQEHKIEGLETGADDYLTKPFIANELLLKINNIIESRRKFREQFSTTLKVEPSELKITSLDKKFMEQAIKIVEENFDDPDFDVEKFSRLIGLSRVGLYNKLKTLTNLPVREFIFLIKLKRAAQLLKESGMSVTQVTYEVGFKTPSHFAKLFKKQFGMSPKAYQNDNIN
ncbi:MAG: response regulator [Ignavibacteriae bacterium]|nr:response regulator [Ignavibacteriota bacterium]